MNVLRDWQAFPSELRGGALCVGNFDGVHIGHARMLATARDEARRRAIPFTIMSFDPHPNVLLHPELVRAPLTTSVQRESLLAAFDPDALIVIPTTRAFLGMPAEDFLARVVRDALGVRIMVEGPTFTFGRGARGTMEMLRAESARFGFEVLQVATEQAMLADLTLVNVSSSLVRWLVERGRVADARRCLGRPYTLRGEVVRGKQRGRKIGFPTANLRCTQLLPAPGIYAGWATLPDARVPPAAISIGTNPTFDGIQTTVEAFLLDYTGDLYGQTIDIALTRWLRDMYAFGGVEPLVVQMRRDVDKVRETISTKEPA